jgi:hypothetical protein
MNWITVGLTVWGVVVPLVALAYGHHLVTASQRKQWVLDNKRQEYRELLSTLSQSAYYILRNSPHLGFGIISAKTGEQERKADEADVEARRIIHDRIFIAGTIQDEKILERWQLLMAEGNGSKFQSDWRDLHETLLKMARKNLNL